MTFSDITKLKLVAPIYEGLAKFFSLGESVTETEIHDKLSSMEPLEKQLETARTLAVAENGTKLASLETRFSEMETKFTDLQTQVEAKDKRIAEMQVQYAEQTTALDTYKKDREAEKIQHQKEIQVLAGEVSSLKAGKPQEQSEGDPTHAAADVNEPLRNGVLPDISKDMKALLGI